LTKDKRKAILERNLTTKIFVFENPNPRVEVKDLKFKLMKSIIYDNTQLVASL